MQKEFISPSTLSKPAGYSHVVTIEGGKLIVLSGQISLNAAGELVGQGDFAAQTRQVFVNIGLALEAVGASYADIIKLTYYIVDYKGEYRQTLLDIRDEFIPTTNSPASTLIGIQTLALPDLIIEIEATAAIA